MAAGVLVGLHYADCFFHSFKYFERILLDQIVVGADDAHNCTGLSAAEMHLVSKLFNALDDLLYLILRGSLPHYNNH